MPKEVAVIGAGIGGLSASYDLAKAGYQVTVFESNSNPGGLAGGFKEEHWEWTVEKYYHHWFATDKHILGLIEELGWSDRVIFPRPYTVMYHRDKFYPFDSILKALMFPGLGWGINKIRFGLVGLYLRLTNNWKPLESVTVESWMRKWVGNEVYELMWRPLLIGKFGENYSKLVNMAWLWARIKARTTRLGTFDGGFQIFVDGFVERLKEMGVDFNFNTPIQKINSNDLGQIEIAHHDGTGIFDKCLVTSSPAVLAGMAGDIEGGYLEKLLNLKSMGAVVMIFALRDQFSGEGYYWYNIPKSAGFPFLAVVEHTNFVSHEKFGGDHILYVGDYLETNHEHFSLTKEELGKRFIPALKRINPEFSADWIRKTWLFKTQYAQPVPEINHSRNIPSIKTPINNLYFACMSQVYPWDRGTNFAVEIGRRTARHMIQE